MFKSQFKSFINRCKKGANLSPLISWFIFLSWGHMVVETGLFWSAASLNMDSIPVGLFHLSTCTSYALVYLAPAILFLYLITFVFSKRTGLIAIAAVILTTICLNFIHMDRIIFDLYRFHFNGFVLNLVLTPGGFESLGADSSSYTGLAVTILRILSIQAVLMAISYGLTARLKIPAVVVRVAVLLLVIAAIGERMIYGISDIRNYGPVLDTARIYPFYQPATFKTLAKKLGFSVEHQRNFAARQDASQIRYPLQPMRYAPVKSAPNIVWLVAESLRGDCLSPEIMPNTWQFAQTAQHFTRHYSSGNGTREGLFGMFYGLSGSSWPSFLHARRPPLLMERIVELDYQLNLRTSARFSYPEFDKTLFVNISPEFLHENTTGGSPWEIDRDNTSALIEFIRDRDRSRPFMTYMFYEATHARYTFPEGQTIFKPVLENIDYSSMRRADLGQYIDQLHNRYNNAAHGVDAQISRILGFLENEKLLANTIVIVTGDHGEEFMEKGFWGHNSSFVEEQILVPMVVWMPGRKPALINRTTTHMDIAVTLLQTLGAVNAPADFALGRNFFDTQPRAYISVSDWFSIGIITPTFKYVIPYDNQRVKQYRPTKPDDTPYSAPAAKQILAKNTGLIIDSLQDFSRFSQ